jgi:ATP-dependent DNA helicase PIF1
MARSKLQTKLLDEFSKLPEWKGLTEGQRDFFRAFFRHKNLFLTGAAGTGKSFAINLLFRFLDSKGVMYGKTATTGVAALNIGGTTIHSWSGMGLADDGGMDLLNKVSENTKAVNRIKNSRVLVIDEVSMAKADLIEKLDIVCQYIRDDERPFGGIQVIFVGDFMQLPPVFTKFEKEEFAFESQAWRDSKVEMVHLTEIIRQHDDKQFAQFLNDVRMGKVKDLKLLEECINRKFPDDGIKPVKLFCKNIDVDDYNLRELDKIVGPSQTYRSTDEASESWSKFFDKNCPAPTRLELKKGAQVMLLVNLDVENGLVNGSVGVVEKVFTDCVEVKFETGMHVIEPYNWEVKQNEFDPIAGAMKKTVLAKRRQLPLRLSWAITCHKSQGATLNRAEINIADAFADGQVYVALSRVRNLKSLSVKPFAMSKIRVNKKCLDFYERQEAESNKEDEFFDE